MSVLIRSIEDCGDGGLRVEFHGNEQDAAYIAAHLKREPGASVGETQARRGDDGDEVLSLPVTGLSRTRVMELVRDDTEIELIEALENEDIENAVRGQ